MKVGRFGLGFKSVFHMTGKVVFVLGWRIEEPLTGKRNYPSKGSLRGRIIFGDFRITLNVISTS